MDLANNGERFTGLADLYAVSRPSVPVYPVELLSSYLGHEPGMVVDLGCGPGISTEVWQGRCREAVGVEPNSDMVRAARELLPGPGIRFLQAFGHETGLPDHSADIVVSSQAFQWMEPVSTFAEIDRILVSGGIFSTIDYEWPPVFNWKAEKAMKRFGKELSALDPDRESNKGVVRWSKKDHIKHMQEAGIFQHIREAFFASCQEYTAERLVGMAMSHSSARFVAEKHPEESSRLIEAFQKELVDILGTGVFPVEISYRMRIGVKR